MEFNIQNNIQMNNQYNMIGNIPNSNKLTVISSSDFSLKEIEKLKNIIVKKISKYDDYRDLAVSIQEECSKIEYGNWIVTVGLRDNMDSFGNSHKSLNVQVGKYKINIRFIAC